MGSEVDPKVLKAAVKEFRKTSGVEANRLWSYSSKVDETWSTVDSLDDYSTDEDLSDFKRTLKQWRDRSLCSKEYLKALDKFCKVARIDSKKKEK